MAYEYAGKIDFLSLKPGFVSTPMTGHKEVDLNTCSVQEFVSAGLRNLGNTSHDEGHWKHQLNTFYYSLMPEGYRTFKLSKRMKNAFGVKA